MPPSILLEPGTEKVDCNLVSSGQRILGHGTECL
jgi:hypothetical protein